MLLPETPAKHGTLKLLVVLAVLIPLAFAAFTEHVWEDFYITYRASRNLAAGNGLVFQPGERVHSFTSPLGVLVPALLARLFGPEGDRQVIWSFRGLSLACAAGSAALLWRVAQRLGLTVLARILLFGLLLLDPKITDFAINGQESALLVFFLAWTIDALLAGGGRPWRLALGFAGLQWSRPDGFVLAAAVTAGLAAFPWRVAPAGQWPARLRWLAASAALALLLYLPWLVSVWVYYGSPLPQPAVAKAAQVGPGHLQAALAVFPGHLLNGTASLYSLFTPAYDFFGGWPDVVRPFSLVLTAPAAFAFLFPGVPATSRALSVATLLGGAYLQVVGPSPWYYPAWQVLTLVALAAAASALVNRFPRARGGLRVAVAVLVTVQAALLAAVAVQMRVRQRDVEDGCRRQIGLWLREQAAPGDTVLLEPLGYVGYFSGLKMLDVPGLSAPEVTRLVRAGHGLGDLVTILEPVWLVLRPAEVQLIRARRPGLLESKYEMRHVFDVRARLAAEGVIPGVGYLRVDAVFLVLHRRLPAPGLEALKPGAAVRPVAAPAASPRR